MGNVERLDKYFNSQDPLSDEEVSQRLDEIKQEIRRDWESYKRSRLCLHGEEVKDNGFDMVIVFLIKRGFFNE